MSRLKTMPFAIVGVVFLVSGVLFLVRQPTGSSTASGWGLVVLGGLLLVLTARDQRRDDEGGGAPPPSPGPRKGIRFKR